MNQQKFEREGRERRTIVEQPRGKELVRQVRERGDRRK